MRSKLKAWTKALRLWSLPLALSSTGMGSFLAAIYGEFDGLIFVLTALTASLLQIVSNLANDYGDTIHGADTRGRVAPASVIQSGALTLKHIKNAITFFAILSLLSGLLLLHRALGWEAKCFVFFLLLGLTAIGAAITYTAGSKPYGYMGLGDVSVFIFFGLVGVLGTFYLHTKQFVWSYLLPAFSCGCFSTAVLNVNNIRDRETDLKAGKKSIPVRIGRKSAILYHWFLLIVGITTALTFMILHYHTPFQLLFLVVVPMLIKNGLAVTKLNPSQLNPHLKQIVLATLIFVLLFGVGGAVSKGLS
ncbi:MAG: 1,4-dihydroxy-2-naphthoate polyprenyltransferase [Cytophagales bacterium]|nr:1,4-dihydroxy-2-naphthoate polyprenyltransferase [Cytophagales bacterium]